MFGLKTIKTVAIAAAFAVLTPLAAAAATVNGTIGITGNVNTIGSTFSITGNVDLVGNGTVGSVEGDFAAYAPVGTSVTLTDIDFTAPLPNTIWEVGGFTFAATAYKDFINMPTLKSFVAVGEITGNGFDTTAGTLFFSTQGPGGVNVTFSSTTAVPVPAAGFLLIGALGGLGLARRRRKTA